MGTEASLLGIVVALVEAAKRAGLPVRFAGLAAVVLATALVMLWDVALGEGAAGSVARWLLAGVIYGLAAAGLYSQGRQVPRVIGAGLTGSRGSDSGPGDTDTNERHDL